MSEPVKILFACPQDDYGGVAEPYPANKNLPEWYRKLPPVDPDVHSAHQSGKTVKSCLPFLDAMTLGWILPVPVDMTVDVSNNGAHLEIGFRYPKNLLSEHWPFQIKGHKLDGRPVRKIMTAWSVRTEPGVSCLITNPLNRDDLPFQVISGIIDTDRNQSYLNLPFFTLLPDGLHEVRKGTPMAQVIPFRRLEFEAEIRQSTTEEMIEAARQVRLIMSEEAAYRKYVRHQPAASALKVVE